MAPQKRHRICAICGTRERHKAGATFFARFPLGENLCKEWLKVVGNQDLVHLPIEKLHDLKYVCERHFIKKDFTKTGTRLKKRAIPKLHLPAIPLTDHCFLEFPLHIGSGLDNIILHCFPNPQKEPERFRSWLYAVGGDILALKNEYIFKYRRICHRHFESRFYTASRRLCANATPTLHLPRNAFVTRPIQEHTSTDMVKVPNTERDQNAGPSATPAENNGGEVPMHSFPNPEKQPDRFRSWLYNVGGDILGLDNQFIYKRRVVCHKHFEEKFHTWVNTLAANAVPTLQLAGTSKKTVVKVDRKELPASSKPEVSIDAPLNSISSTQVRDDEYRLEGFDSDPDDPDPATNSVHEEERSEENYVDDTPFIVKACVGCLSIDGELTDLSDSLKIALHNATGLQVEEDDPSSLCFQCLSALRHSSNFRKQCYRAQEALLDSLMQTDESWQTAILTIDREKYNLTSRLSICNNTPEITIVFDGDDPEEDVDVKADLDEKTDVHKAFNSNDVDDIPADDGPADDEPADDIPVDDVPEDIDLNDVFKGLKEESESELESLCGDPDSGRRSVDIFKIPKKQPEIKVPNKNKDREVIEINSKFLKEASMALAQADIRYLTPQEQREVYKKSLEDPSFKRHLFRCAVCVQVFYSKEQLMAHVKYHSGQISYKYLCDICKNRFRTELQCTKHSMYCHWYQYTHTQCTDTHYNLQSLVECFTTNRKWKPSEIELKYDYITPLHQHFELIPMTPEERYLLKAAMGGPMVCNICGRRFFNHQTFKAHRDMHKPRPSTPYQCDVCKIYQSSTTILKRHITMYHMYKYKCRYCLKELVTNYDARRHLEDCKDVIQKASTDTSILCLICNERFNSTMSLNSHSCARGIHCSSCGHRATSVQRQYQHQLREHAYIRLSSAAELNDPRYYCIECRVYFANIDAYYGHLARLHHAEATTYTNGCISCATLFPTAEELKEHLCPSKFSKSENAALAGLRRRRGPVTRGVLCHICGKILTDKGMTFHIKVHAHDRWRCKFCSFSHTNVDPMVVHILNNHTYRPYMCALCPQRYVHKHLCREHILKVHAPVLPYSCEVCGRKFAHLDLLNDHCRKIHCVDLKKIDRSVFLAKNKMLGKIYVYPHLKIDASLIPEPLQQKLTLYLCDYMENDEHVLENNLDHLYIDPYLDPSKPTREPPMLTPYQKQKQILANERRKMETRRKRQAQMELAQARKRMKTDVRSDDQEVLSAVAMIKAEKVINKEVIPAVAMISDENYETRDNNSSVMIIDESEEIKEVVTSVSIDQNEDVIMKDEDNEQFESVVGQLVVHDDKQYVLVDGVMYEVDT